MHDEETPLTNNGASGEDADRLYTSYVLMGVESMDELQASWSIVQCVGIMNVLLGMLCLVYPIAATEFVAGIIVLSVLLGGIMNVASVCFTSSDSALNATEAMNAFTFSRAHFFWVGLIQICLGLFLWFHPFAALNALTLTIASFYMLLGILQLTVSCSLWQDSAASPGQRYLYWAMVPSGVLAIALSLIVVIDLPLSSWYTIGILTGANLVNLGCSRIILSCHGRRLAREQQ